MPQKHRDQAKNLIEAIITGLCSDENKDILTINTNINAICDGIDFCPDRQIAELRISYFALKNQFDPEVTFDSFIKNLISIYKYNFFSHVVTPLNSSQNVHVLNFWLWKMNEELGFDFDFKTNIGTMSQDRFQGSESNVLYYFFEMFTPEEIIKLITSEINSNNFQICKACEIISKMQIKKTIKRSFFGK